MDFLCDRDRLLELLRNFHIITDIKTVVFDHEMKTIAAYPYEECAFCAALSQVPEAQKQCHRSTVEGCLLCKKRKSLNIYKCHAGLIEAVTPIRIGDIIVGYMMLGQVLDKTDRLSGTDKIIAYATGYLGPEAAKYCESLVCKSGEEIKAAASIMECCVCELLMNHVIREGNGKVAFDIVRHIENHLSGDLSVSALCDQFDISRSTLYRIADIYLGMPVARYVRKKRIEKAEALIRSGISVTKVAEQLRFCDYGYFGKVFKSISGKTPTEIR